MTSPKPMTVCVLCDARTPRKPSVNHAVCPACAAAVMTNEEASWVATRAGAASLRNHHPSSASEFPRTGGRLKRQATQEEVEAIHVDMIDENGRIVNPYERPRRGLDLAGASIAGTSLFLIGVILSALEIPGSIALVISGAAVTLVTSILRFARR